MAARAFLGFARLGYPYVSYTLVLDDNWPSRRTAEKLGLRLVWRGPDADNPDPDAGAIPQRQPAPQPSSAVLTEIGTGVLPIQRILDAALDHLDLRFGRDRNALFDAKPTNIFLHRGPTGETVKLLQEAGLS